MATNTRPTKVPMDRNRKIALAAGALYIATFVTSIPALGLYHTALHDPSFLTGTGSTGSVALGAWLEMLCASPASAPPSCSTRSSSERAAAAPWASWPAARSRRR